MTDDEPKMSGLMYKSAEANTMLVFVSNNDAALVENMPADEFIEATRRLLCNRYGFNDDSFVLSTNDGEINHSVGYVTKVKFVGDGIVMAKLQDMIT
jgi:hypothetical protein